MQGLQLLSHIKGHHKGKGQEHVGSKETNDANLLELLSGDGEDIDTQSVPFSPGKKSENFSSVLNKIQGKTKDSSEVPSKIINIINEDEKVVLKKPELIVSNQRIGRLLDELKSTTGEEEENVPSNTPKNFFPNQLNKKIENKESLPEDFKTKEKIEGPLDFIVKNAKYQKLGQVENINSSEDVQPSLTLKKETILIPRKVAQSGEDFVSTKQLMEDGPKELKKPELKLIKAQAKEEDIAKNSSSPANEIPAFFPKKNVAVQMAKYQTDQNVVNHHMIKNSPVLIVEGKELKEIKDGDIKDFKKEKNSKKLLDEISSIDGKEIKKITISNNTLKDMPLPIVMSKGANDFAMENIKNPAKLLDLSHINTANANELIDKITDYVMQSNVAGKDKMDLNVTHESLGQFQIQVTRNQASNTPNQIEMQIVTTNNEGHKFFTENEGNLMKSLQQSGLNMGELKIVNVMSEISTQGFSESKQFNSFNQSNDGQQASAHWSEGFSSKNFEGGQQKRRDLWNEYRERYGA